MQTASHFTKIAFRIFTGMILILAILKQAEAYTGKIDLNLAWGKSIVWFATPESFPPAPDALQAVREEQKYRRLISDTEVMLSHQPIKPTFTLLKTGLHLHGTSALSSIELTQ